MLLKYGSEQNSDCFYEETGGPSLTPEMVRKEHISKMKMVYAPAGYNTVVMFSRDGYITDMVGIGNWYTFVYDSVLLKKGIRRVKTMEYRFTYFDPMPVLKRLEYYYNEAGEIDSISTYAEPSGESYVDPSGKMIITCRIRYENGWPLQKATVYVQEYDADGFLQSLESHEPYLIGNIRNYTYNALTNTISCDKEEVALFHESYTPADSRLWPAVTSSIDTLQTGNAWIEPLKKDATCKRDSKGRIISRTDLAGYTCTFTYDELGLPLAAEASRNKEEHSYRFAYERYK